jgi:hypothetical protein
MKIIQPYDLSQIRLEDLIREKKVLPAQDNRVWHASIFPESKDVEVLSKFDSKNVLTKIDDSLFSDFITLDKVEQLVSYRHGHKYIKCTEFGDYHDSIKRYTQLDKPVDYKQNVREFVSFPGLESELNVIPVNLIHTSEPLEARSIDFKHPHISQRPNTRPSKMNNRTVIEEVLKWAKEKGIKYIYCINEWRPHVISKQFASSFVYYTIKGSK